MNFIEFQLRPSWISEMDMFKEADDLIGEYIEENPMGKISYIFHRRRYVSIFKSRKCFTT